jgi:hypothetical protein
MEVLYKDYSFRPYQLTNMAATGKSYSENQLIRELLSSSKAEITFSKDLSDFDKVLSSA